MSTAARNLSVILAVAWVLFGPAGVTQDVYKYRDDNGNWVYMDRKPNDVADVERQVLENQTISPAVALRRLDHTDRTEIVVDNAYFAPVELAMRFAVRDNVRGDVPDGVRTVVGPSTNEVVVLTVWPEDPEQPWDFQMESYFIPGHPEAEHRPERPYGVPIAQSTSFLVTQAYPSSITHDTRASAYAVDIAMPVGTHIFAARSGTVIDIATHCLTNGIDVRKDGARANIVRILHSDGTMAVYAHLNWDSIRVRPGDTVERGQYIADSGNTGFSTGPHLHFAVQKNAGLELESVPFQFEGQLGRGFYPMQGQELTAN